MKRFDFSIVASGLDPSAQDFETRFYDAGCDDATVSFQKGHIIVDFTRKAGSIAAALASAVRNVAAAGAKVERVEPDPLVSLADIAARTGLSRAAISQYSRGQRRGEFPPPVVRITSESPLWDWASVAKWLFLNAQASRQTAIEAEAIRLANAAIQTREPQLEKTLRGKLESYDKALKAA